MKWSWRPKWMRTPEVKNDVRQVEESNGAKKATASKREAQKKLRETIASGREIQEVLREGRRLNDKFGEAIQQAMRRPANG